MMDIGEDSSAKKLLIKLKKGDILIICSAINIWWELTMMAMTLTILSVMNQFNYESDFDDS